MKKFLLATVMMIGALAANAQAYIGGELGLWRDWDNNQTTFKIAPELGYNLTDKWAIGIYLGYEHDYSNGVAVNGVDINPYARFTFAKVDRVNFFVDGGFDVAYAKAQRDGHKLYDATPWNIGFRPGMAVNLNEKCALVAHLGFLGYADNDDVEGRPNGLGFDFSSYTVNFGFYYNF